jgi:cytidylate kinase
MGLRTKLVESVDEKRRGWLASCLELFSRAPDITETDYARHLAHVMSALAAHGECVIVGRDAAQALPAATTLRDRLVGALEQRVKTIRERFDLADDEARRWVEKTDHDRARFVKDHLGRDVEDASLYDLVLNTSRLSVADCADLIVAAVERFQGAEEPATLPRDEADAVC